MKTVRYGVFETNSSSCHSLVICKEEDYEAWKAGKSALNVKTGAIMPMSEFDELCEKANSEGYTEADEEKLSSFETYKDVHVGVELDSDDYMEDSEPKKLGGFVAFIMKRLC